MIPGNLSTAWHALAPALGNHLWQSTAFALSAGLLTLILRRNHARVRYGLWLAASLKFLIPVSWLIAIGSYLAPSRPVATGDGLYFVVDQVSRPFTRSLPRLIFPDAPPQVSSGFTDLLPMLLATMWLAGFLVVLVVWLVRWLRIAAIIRAALPLRAGREVEALRYLEAAVGTKKPLTIRLAPNSLEPGIFGIFRPILVWPDGISKHLDDAQLKAVLAHELCHVRRRDNLAAAMHMIVEALFWFHPLVWWLGTRLVEERERACDEQVLDSGSAPNVYAESILKTCEFCVESPLACVSGVTGADLKKRIVRIMTQSRAEKLGFSRKLLLATVGMLVVAGPVSFGLLHSAEVRAQSPITGTPLFSYDVASIKPDHLDGHNTRVDSTPDSLTVKGMSLKRLIAYAYNVKDFQISGGSGWIDTETYEIQAKIDDATIEALKKLPRAERGKQHFLMVQSLLADRFKLKLSHSSKELPIYALALTKDGPKFARSTVDDDGQNISSRNGDVTVQATISHFADWLSSVVGRHVIDQTGLQGKYDLKLKYDDRQIRLDPDSADTDNSLGPSIFTALRDQLGLKLEAKKGPVDTLIVDSAEKPSPN